MKTQKPLTVLIVKNMFKTFLKNLKIHILKTSIKNKYINKCLKHCVLNNVLKISKNTNKNKL